MATQTAPYGIDGTTLTYPQSKYIASKQHCKVFLQLTSDDSYTTLDVADYDLIGNSVVLKEAISGVTYKQINIVVADTQDELGDNPTDTAIVSAIADEIVTVAGIVDEVVTVAGLTVEIQSIYADRVGLQSIYADKATLDSIYADKTTLDGLFADKVTLDSLYADKTTLDSLYADKAQLDAIYANLTEILEADEKAWEAEASRLTSNSYAAEAEDVFVNIWTSDGDGTYTSTPTTEYSALHWAAKAEEITGGSIDSLTDVDTTGKVDEDLLTWDGSNWVPLSRDEVGTKTTAPTISFSSPIDENTTGNVITITNHDADAAYTFGTTGDVGTIDYTSGDTATIDAVDITDDLDHDGTITCYATKAGELKSVTASEDITITYIASTADDAISDDLSSDVINDGY